MKLLIALLLLAGCPDKKDNQAAVATPLAAAIVSNPLADGGLGDGGPLADALAAMPMADAPTPMPPADGLSSDAGPL
jgi:hypothetical protein